MSNTVRNVWIQVDLDNVGEMQINKLNDLLKPNKYSICGFISENQHVVNIIRNDRNTLANINITPKMIVDKLMELCNAYSQVSKGMPTGESVNYKNYTIGMTNYLGYQKCPFEVLYDNPNYNANYWANCDIIIINTKLGKKMIISSMMLHLIGHYCFFEGPGTKYRVDPREICLLLELI